MSETREGDGWSEKSEKQEQMKARPFFLTLVGVASAGGSAGGARAGDASAYTGAVAGGASAADGAGCSAPTAVSAAASLIIGEGNRRSGPLGRGKVGRGGGVGEREICKRLVFSPPCPSHLSPTDEPTLDQKSGRAASPDQRGHALTGRRGGLARRGPAERAQGGTKAPAGASCFWRCPVRSLPSPPRLPAAL